MADQTRTGVLVRMPTQLKQGVVDEAKRSGSSMNDVVVSILAERFSVPFSLSGRTSNVPSGGSGVVVLRMPPELKRRIHEAAFETESNANDVILGSLAERLGIPFDSKRRRTVPFGGGGGKETMVAARNGKVRASDKKVRVAIIGVGNCANSFMQGLASL